MTLAHVILSHRILLQDGTVAQKRPRHPKRRDALSAKLKRPRTPSPNPDFKYPRVVGDPIIPQNNLPSPQRSTTSLDSGEPSSPPVSSPIRVNKGPYNRLSPGIVSKLKEMWDSHGSMPPLEERKAFAAANGLKSNQVYAWFSRKRETINGKNVTRGISQASQETTPGEIPSPGISFTSSLHDDSGSEELILTSTTPLRAESPASGSPFPFQSSYSAVLPLPLSEYGLDNPCIDASYLWPYDTSDPEPSICE